MCDTQVGREGHIFVDVVPATTLYIILRDIMDPLLKVSKNTKTFPNPEENCEFVL